MNRLVDFVSRGLDSAERDAVLGDLAESGESGARELAGVLGLVVRRQAELWKDWRPWVLLMLLILPLGLLLSVASQITARGSATYSWLYLNNWDWSLLQYREFWYELRDSLVVLSVRWVSLACWSWTAGFVLGSVSRRLLAANGVLICLTLLLCGLFAAPEYLAYVFPDPGPPDASDPVGALMFYGYVFPLIVRIILVAAPCIWAMRQGSGMGKLPPLVRAVILTTAIVALVAMVMRQPGIGWVLKTYRYPEFWQSWEIRALQNVVYWPAAYLIGGLIVRRWRSIHV